MNILRCADNRKFALLLDRKINLLKVFDFAWKQSVKVQHFEATILFVFCYTTTVIV